MPLLKVDNLTKIYGQFTALKEVSFNLEQSTTTYLYGKNGAGKTTLLEILCGLQKSSQGRVAIFDEDLLSQSEKIYKRIGVLFTDSFLYGDLSIEENLIFFSRLHEVKDPEEKIDDMLRKFNLADKRRSLIKHLSSGLEKRAGLARTFLPDPELLIMDEPTLGLDRDSKSEVVKLIREFTSRGRSLLFTSHDINFARELACSVLYLEEGRLVFEGSFEEAKNKDYIEL